MKIISFGSMVRVQGNDESLNEVSDQIAKNSKLLHESIFCKQGFDPLNRNVSNDNAKGELLFINGLADNVKRIFLRRVNTIPKHTVKEDAKMLKLIKGVPLLKVEDVLRALKEGNFDFKKLIIKK